MRIFVPKELHHDEHRVPIVPDTVKKLAAKEGAHIVVESGLGEKARFVDGAYSAAGAEIAHDRAAALAEADMVLRLRKPPQDEIALLKRGAIHVSFLDPFNEP